MFLALKYLRLFLLAKLKLTSEDDRTHGDGPLLQCDRDNKIVFGQSLTAPSEASAPRRDHAFQCGPCRAWSMCQLQRTRGPISKRHQIECGNGTPLKER